MNLQVPGEGIVKDFGMVMYTLLYLKMYNQQEPIVYHMELSQCYVLARMRGEFGWEERIHFHV